MDDIDLWELSEAFAVQVLYWREKLGIPNDKLNVNGGSISIGRRRRTKNVVVTKCIGAGMGGAGLFDVMP